MTQAGEKIIGVVGGAGPFAGLDLLGKILEQTVAERDQDHLTVISLSQPNRLPDRTKFLLGETAVNPAYAIFDQLRQLERAGACVAAIPCNTAHVPAIDNIVREKLQAAGSRIKFLHMIAETARHIRQRYADIQRIGVLSTTGTYQTQIYPSQLEPEGFTTLVPDVNLQTKVIHPAIDDPQYGIKVLGSNARRAREGLLQGADNLRRQGAEAIILGCTEIPLAITETRLNEMIVIDPTLILARALIREVNLAKLLPSG
ncbi:MAG: aspartate/glutamate racemase family protein [Chloroflexi bacterium]|nr:aspartate/glutamate racemase family protein [Chloroflexota bacterium]